MDGPMCGTHMFPIGEEGYYLACIEDRAKTKQDVLGAIVALIEDIPEWYELHNYKTILQDIMFLSQHGMRINNEEPNKKVAKNCEEFQYSVSVVPLEQVKITKAFATTIPAAKKIAKRVDFFKKNKSFDNQIILDKDMVLHDGYTQYLVCKMFGIKHVAVYTKVY